MTARPAGDAGVRQPGPPQAAENRTPAESWRQNREDTMGIISNDGQHEGYLEVAFPDGAFGSGSTAGGVIMSADYDAPGPVPDYVTRDGREAIGWRGKCECGWTGRLWHRTLNPDAENHDDKVRAVYDQDPNVYGDPPAVLHDTLFPREWGQHLPPGWVSDIREDARAANEAAARLAEAVRKARDKGGDWAMIADAAGITEDQARKRWEW